MQHETLPLEDYGLIGNLETCALVGRDGSLDWLCLPSLESPAVFAALLDPARGGRFALTPRAKFASCQRYLPGTNILVTRFETQSGQAALTDFMPPVAHDDDAVEVWRKLEGLEGWLEFELEWTPRFDYGRLAPEVRLTGQTIEARADGRVLVLHADVPVCLESHDARARFRLEAGRTVWFCLRHGPATDIGTGQAEERHGETRRFWEAWQDKPCVRDCRIEPRWRDLAHRGGLVLKLLASAISGGIAAAPTTSLPETIGGLRNWDYRYVWVRDASLTVQALYHLGHEDEVLAFRRWIESVVKTESPAVLKVFYPRHPGMAIGERILDNLDGYAGSKPVRVGNDAARQNQLDIYGEVISAVYETARYGHEVDQALWDALRGLVEHVESSWQDEDAGLWELRAAPRHHVYSKVMCWVALDRAVRIVTEHGFDAPIDRWRDTGERIRQAVLSRGFDDRLGSFVQSFDSTELDAATLLIPLYGFLPPDDSRVLGTIRAVMDRLMVREGLVRRYRIDDGLTGREGAFGVCGFWLVQALALAGEVDRAEAIFEEIARYASPLGLFSEEIDPRTGRLLGNFPQAFTHIGCVNAALYLAMAKGRQSRHPLPMGLPG